MELVYKVEDVPKLRKLIVFALQQLLAIMAATIAVPAIINSSYPQMHMTASAALFGAGCGTIVYLLFTKFRSPVFLGSSFAFLGSMAAACAGAVSVSVGYLGFIIGAVFAGLVYVGIALVIKFCGVKWIDKLMPAVVIGPTVSIIGLSLAGNAIGDLVSGSYKVGSTGYEIVTNAQGIPTGIEAVTNYVPTANTFLCLLCGLVTLFTVILCSVFGKKMMKLIPFVIGIAAGYVLAAIFSIIGIVADIPALHIINFEPLTSLFTDFSFTSILNYPDWSFLEAFKGGFDFGKFGSFGVYLGTVAVAYIPVAFVVFAEHIADHKNLSSVIGKDLLADPGLDKTLLGDGVGSMVGAFFGGCPNTTYGESVGCVAITRNASVATILGASVMAIAISFVSPFVGLLATIPACVMGGVCMALYGFIAVSGLKMIQKVDLDDSKNLFTVSAILIAGIGSLTLTIGKVTLTSIACALILGILINVTLNAIEKKKGNKNDSGEN